MSDKKKLAIEAGLLLSGAALGAAGAIIIEPAVILAGIAAAGAGAVMRFNDRHVKVIEGTEDNHEKYLLQK